MSEREKCFDECDVKRVKAFRTLTYFIRGSITVRLTSCLNGLNSAALVMFNQQLIYLFGQATQTGGQLYSETSPYEVSVCYLMEAFSTVEGDEGSPHIGPSGKMLC